MSLSCRCSVFAIRQGARPLNQDKEAFPKIVLFVPFLLRLQNASFASVLADSSKDPSWMACPLILRKNVSPPHAMPLPSTAVLNYIGAALFQASRAGRF